MKWSSDSESEAGLKFGESKLLEDLNESLHGMSQPMTVLLCTLEYGADLESLDETKQTIAISLEACGRLRESITSMQTQVRVALEERAARS